MNMLYHLTIYNAICKSLYLCVCVSVCPLLCTCNFCTCNFFSWFLAVIHIFCVFNAFLWFFEVFCNFSSFCGVIFYVILSPGRVSCYILYLIYNFRMCVCVSVCLCVCLSVCVCISKSKIIWGSRLIFLSCAPYGAWPCQKNRENKIPYLQRS